MVMKNKDKVFEFTARFTRKRNDFGDFAAKGLDYMLCSNYTLPVLKQLFKKLL
jgi:hypothetical protein